MYPVAYGEKRWKRQLREKFNPCNVDDLVYNKHFLMCVFFITTNTFKFYLEKAKIILKSKHSEQKKHSPLLLLLNE